jgi:quinone-modifying oxidoreductase subunit QmoC
MLSAAKGSGPMKRCSVDPGLFEEVAQYGARDMNVCMQCGACTASCPLSMGDNIFPRKIYRHLQLGLRDDLLQSCEPWLCYYCGECNQACPRGAEPAETMMAARRWLTAQYDWTGLAKRFYLSAAWEIGALLAVAIGVIALFWFGHGPMLTDRVSVNTFAPVLWVEVGDLILAAVLSILLLSNAFRMYRLVMGDTKAPLRLYVAEARTFVQHFLTQKRWRQCSEDTSRWLKHFLLVTGYLTMMALVIVFIRWFQVDDSSWHFTSLFGYYATGVLLFITAEMCLSRRRKGAALHRFSEVSDWLFLILLFATALSGIIMHAARLLGLPTATYVMYALHLAIAVPMLVVEVPFGKWSHLLYRPLAIFLAAVKEKAAKRSKVELGKLKEQAGDRFVSCMQCGVCTSVCPESLTGGYNPRRILQDLVTGNATEKNVDRAVWRCVTCDACDAHCPRGIAVTDLVAAVRLFNVRSGDIPDYLKAPLENLHTTGNPYQGGNDRRTAWLADITPSPYRRDDDYALFACCAAGDDPGTQAAGRALVRTLSRAGLSFSALGSEVKCCGDLALRCGDTALFESLSRENSELFHRLGLKNVVTTSPHCLDVFRKRYPGLAGTGRSVHYTELLDSLLTDGRVLPTGRDERIATYHDPCYLGRHNGIYAAPRRILQSIPGLRLVEMARNRSESPCCGGGGGRAWDESSQELAKQRVREALDTGAEVLVTSCPHCLRMLSRAVRELGLARRLAINDVADLLWQSICTGATVGAPLHGQLTLSEEAQHG